MFAVCLFLPNRASKRAVASCACLFLGNRTTRVVIWRGKRQPGPLPAALSEASFLSAHITLVDSRLRLTQVFNRITGLRSTSPNSSEGIRNKARYTMSSRYSLP